MKHTLCIIATLLIGSGVTLAALDASLLQNEAAVPSTAAPASIDSEALIALVEYTTNTVTASALKNTADYFGKGQIVITVSGNADAAYTNDVVLFEGAVTATNEVATLKAHTGNTRNMTVYDIDFDADLSLAKWQVKSTAETDNAAAYQVGVTLIKRSVPSAAQTVTGSAVDKMPFTGVGNIVVNVGVPEKASATYSATVQIQHAAASTGTWSNVSGRTTTITGATGGVGTIPYDFTSGNRYIRAVVTSTNDVAPVGVTINSHK